MQGRMKTHQLTEQQVEILLSEEQVGRLATHNPDGFPYLTPVHFVYFNKKIYIHGLNKGQKIDNIKNNPQVGFEVDKMEKLMLSDRPCDVNTAYKSVIVLGEANLLKSTEQKITVLKKIVEKYTPSLAGRELPQKMVKTTSVIEISIFACTGKYYD